MTSTMDTASTPDERIAEPAAASPASPAPLVDGSEEIPDVPEAPKASPDVPGEDADAPGAVDTSADEVDDDDEDENPDEKADADDKKASGDDDPFGEATVSEEAYAAFERSLGIEPEPETAPSLDPATPLEDEGNEGSDDDSETGFVKFELLMGCLKDKSPEEDQEEADKNQSGEGGGEGGEGGDPLDELEQFMDALEDRDPADDSSEDEFDKEAANLISYVDFMTTLRSKAQAQLAERRMGGDPEFAAFLDRLEGNKSEDVFYDAVDGNDDEFAAFLASLTSPTTEDPADYTSPEDLVWSQILEGMPTTDRVGFVGWLLGAEPDKPVITMAEGDRILWPEQSWGGCLRAWFGAAVVGPQEEDVVVPEVDRELDEKRRGEVKTRIEVVRAEDPAAEVPAAQVPAEIV